MNNLLMQHTQAGPNAHKLGRVLTQIEITRLLIEGMVGLQQDERQRAALSSKNTAALRASDETLQQHEQ